MSESSIHLEVTGVRSEEFEEIILNVSSLSEDQSLPLSDSDNWRRLWCQNRLSTEFIAAAGGGDEVIQVVGGKGTALGGGVVRDLGEAK